MYYLSRGPTIDNQELNTEALLAVPIQDNEIFELLERLAATEEMFMTPVSTIRDVAELTEASPSLIARLLDDIRGTDEFMNLVTQVKQHETRVGQVEKKVSALERSKNSSTQKTAQDAEKEFAENVVRAIAVVVVVIILFVAAINSSRKANSQGNSFLHGRQLWIDDNGNVTEQKGFEVTPVPENDPDARELRSMTAANRNKK